MNSIDVLASIIREVDVLNGLGPEDLAEAIHAHPRAQEAFAPPKPPEVEVWEALDLLEGDLFRYGLGPSTVPAIRRALLKIMDRPGAAAPEVVVSHEKAGPRDLSQPPAPSDCRFWSADDPRWLRFKGNTGAAAKARMQEAPVQEESAPEAAAPEVLPDPEQPPHAHPLAGTRFA